MFQGTFLLLIPLPFLDGEPSIFASSGHPMARLVRYVDGGEEELRKKRWNVRAKGGRSYETRATGGASVWHTHTYTDRRVNEPEDSGNRRTDSRTGRVRCRCARSCAFPGWKRVRFLTSVHWVGVEGDRWLRGLVSQEMVMLFRYAVNTPSPLLFIQGWRIENLKISSWDFCESTRTVYWERKISTGIIPFCHIRLLIQVCWQLTSAIARVLM